MKVYLDLCQIWTLALTNHKNLIGNYYQNARRGRTATQRLKVAKLMREQELSAKELFTSLMSKDSKTMLQGKEALRIICKQKHNNSKSFDKKIAANKLKCRLSVKIGHL